MNTPARILATALALMIPLAGSRGQSEAPRAEYHFRSGAFSPGATAFALSMAAARDDDKSDAGYALYKEGYALVLEEKYAEARKKFGELLSKYPGSSYADDARYWSAYSMRNTDRQKAVEEYRKFIREHPKSSYYDDAVADLNALQMDAPVAVAVSPAPPRHAIPDAIGPNTGMMFRQMNREMRQMARFGNITPMPGPFPGWREQRKLDDATKLKMDALYALGETKEDDRSFTTLRDVALDRHQVLPLREAAMDALSGFTKHDALSVYVEIARNDTSAEIQGSAIDYIGEHGSDKNQRVSALEDLFRTLPKSRIEGRRTILFTIADVGNERAVEFLKRVALADEDYDLRRDAVYYLGSIGGESARSALYEILKGH
ncbi:MAG TPA: HEAT repeat domain-containing protein [Bacteroidota bacterium]|nr:HEAT repeat domain-containing protein [Bacteroidota bacterium]